MVRALLFLVLLSPIARAEDDDLVEAPVIESPSEAPVSSSSANDNFRYRAYAFAEGRWRYSDTTRTSQFEGPYLEADATLDYKASDTLRLFFDGMANYSQYTNSGLFSLNQVGVRVHAGEWVFAVGRERNRRSPGLFVSPSDPLHTNPTLAGPREIRTGEWIARVSHQAALHSTDVFYVPFRTLTKEGFPNESPRGEFWLRHFHKVGPIDLDLSGGRLDGKWRGGLSALGFLASVWKFYGEFGYREGDVWSALLGAAFEGNDDFSVRTEFLYSSTASLTPVPLPRGWLWIVNVGFPEVADRFNFYLTGIQSLESSITVGLLRAEWLANNHNTFGTSFLLSPSRDIIWSADWRYSF
ncbi:MAG: hypothetical protein KDD39_10610 [Bdellovibrionales bacterium]|nr:hypothetical protein [Bdellovibrionales bacterium]